jgi:hypothetical protein
LPLVTQLVVMRKSASEGAVDADVDVDVDVDVDSIDKYLLPSGVFDFVGRHEDSVGCSFCRIHHANAEGNLRSDG